jgi:hypothetical protein
MLNESNQNLTENDRYIGYCADLTKKISEIVILFKIFKFIISIIIFSNRLTLIMN